MVAGKILVAETLATVIADERVSRARLELRNLCLGFIFVFIFILVRSRCSSGGLDVVDRFVLVVLEPLERALH